MYVHRLLRPKGRKRRRGKEYCACTVPALPGRARVGNSYVACVASGSARLCRLAEQRCHAHCVASRILRSCVQLPDPRQDCMLINIKFVGNKKKREETSK